MSSVSPRPSAARHSRSAEAARAAERERVARMSPRERIVLALRLGRRAAVLAGCLKANGG